MQKLTWLKATIFSGRIDFVCVRILIIIRFKEFIRLLIIFKKSLRKDRIQEKNGNAEDDLSKLLYLVNKQTGEATLCFLRHFVVVSQIFQSKSR